MDLFLMPMLAGETVVHERGAIGTESTLAVFAEAQRGLIRMVVTDHNRYKR
jgi:hypothetical protein